MYCTFIGDNSCSYYFGHGNCSMASKMKNTCEHSTLNKPDSCDVDLNNVKVLCVFCNAVQNAKVEAALEMTMIGGYSVAEDKVEADSVFEIKCCSCGKTIYKKEFIQSCE